MFNGLELHSDTYWYQKNALRKTEVGGINEEESPPALLRKICKYHHITYWDDPSYIRSPRLLVWLVCLTLSQGDSACPVGWLASSSPPFGSSLHWEQSLTCFWSAVHLCLYQYLEERRCVCFLSWRLFVSKWQEDSPSRNSYKGSKWRRWIMFLWAKSY